MVCLVSVCCPVVCDISVTSSVEPGLLRNVFKWMYIFNSQRQVQTVQNIVGVTGLTSRRQHFFIKSGGFFPLKNKLKEFGTFRQQCLIAVCEYKYLFLFA